MPSPKNAPAPLPILMATVERNKQQELVQPKLEHLFGHFTVHSVERLGIIENNNLRIWNHVLINTTDDNDNAFIYV